jgi:hypothetical protein
MSDETLDEQAFKRTVLKLTGQSTDEERPERDELFAEDDRARQQFANWRAAEAKRAEKATAEEKAEAERKPEPTTSRRREVLTREEWHDIRIAAALEADGPIGAVIAEVIAELHDKIDGLTDRIRECELATRQQDVELGRRDVEIKRQALEIAELQSRDRRGGTIVEGVPSSLKSIN